MVMVFRVIMIFLTSSAFLAVTGQDFDKLHNDLSGSKGNTKVLALNQIAWEHRKLYPDSCRFYAKWALNEAQSSGNDEGESLALRRLATAHRYLGNLDSAIFYINLSIKIEESAERPFRQGSAFQNKAQLLFLKGDWENALLYYHKAIDLFEAIDSMEHVAKGYNSTGKVHERLGNDSLALLGYTKSLRLRESLKDSAGIANSLLNLSGYYAGTHRFSEAKKALRRSEIIWTQLNNLYEVGRVYGSLGSVFLEMDKLDSAVYYYQKSLEGPYGEKSPFVHCNLGILYMELDKPDSGLIYLKSGLEFARSQQNSFLEKTILENMSQAYEMKGEYKDAFYSYELYKSLEDSISSSKVEIRVREIQEKYDNQKLTSEKLQAQQAQKEEETKNQRLMIAAISLGALLVIAILITTLYKQRLTAKNQMAIKDQEIHRKQLDELVKEKELERVTSLMEGQEKERARIARELHDGLGSLLATVKHHYQTVEDKMDQGQDQFESANRLLDDACVEVRRISHDMASNVLSKFGLIAALQDYVETIASSGAIKLELKVSGVNDRLENSKEIHLFRIVQELVSNVLKHAEATSATIHFTAHQDSLNVLVEDNGKGFDTKEMGQRDGMGMANLGARVAHLEGTLDIDSSLGKGTTVIIEVPTQQNV